MNSNQSTFSGILLDERYRWLWHILFWIFTYLDEFLSIFGLTPALEDPEKIVFGLLIDMFVVYINLYFLFPKFLMKKKFLLYALGTSLSILLITAYNHVVYDFEFDEFFFSNHIVSFLHNSFMLGLALAIKLVKESFNNQISFEKMSSERLRTELGFLKNQVNPHFLFNTMNSLYIQAKKKDARLPDAIMTLSDLLRYQIYDTQKEYVPVTNEFEYFKNYLDLEKARRDNLSIEIFESGLSKSKKIAPLLLLPLVENAVKYSQRTDGQTAFINLVFKIEDNQIYFEISNSKGKVDEIRSPDSGLGHTNVKKRLGLIYPDDHTFNIIDEEKIYKAVVILGAR